MRKMSTQRKVTNIFVYVFLSLLALIWVLPIFWVILTSFREESGSFTPYFLPREYSLKNYINLLTDNSTFDFPRWFMNTLFVSVVTCIISTFFVLSVSYTMSRLRFRLRKPLMNIALILGMFPGFMSMIAVYYVLKSFGIEQSLLALILVYSAGTGLGFYVAKGFFEDFFTLR